MRVEPASILDVAVGQSFTVNLTVVSASALFTWQITLLYNSTILSCTSAVYPASGDIFAGHTTIPVSPYINDTRGYVSFGASLTGSDIASGSGILCRITFKVTATGTSGLNFSQPYGTDTFMLDGDLNIVSASTEEGSFSNVSVQPQARHDIAVTDLSFSNNNPTQGDSVTVTVTVRNNGTTVESSFDVRVFNGSTMIGTQSVSGLPAGNNRTLTFSWNTSGAPSGQNSITADASAVLDEKNLANNELSGTVTVLSSRTGNADVNGDGRYDMKDIALVCWSFGTQPGDTRWRAFADISGPQGAPDGLVDQFDIAEAVRKFWRIAKS